MRIEDVMIETGELRDELKALLANTIQTGEITLASGRTTDFYFDGRLVTLSPAGLRLVSRLSVETLRGSCDAVGGPTSGADPIVAGIGQAALDAGWDVATFFTRKEAKGHGMQRRIEGPALASASRVVIVDDVATSGGSILQSAGVVREEAGATVDKALVIVDREEGAREALAADGIELIALFRRSDFT